LHVHEWGDPGAPPLICLHGVTAHGQRFKPLAERRWADRFRVVAPDLRGHGRSGYEPPWNLATHVADLIETADSLGIEQADWLGHSFGGRLVLELAAAHPERIRRAVLLDPGIDVLPHVALFAAEQEGNGVYESYEAYAASRNEGPTTPPELVIEDAKLYFQELPDGRVRRSASPPAISAIYGELASAPPPPETLQAPTLLIHAPAYGVVREEHLAAYDGRVEKLAVPGGHIVMWDAFDEVADAVERFLLEDSGAER
jgi:lipase